VSEVDPQGVPFVRYVFRNKRGVQEWHWLALCDESWERELPADP
jgi:hypothetical protein